MKPCVPDLRIRNLAFQIYASQTLRSRFTHLRMRKSGMQIWNSKSHAKIATLERRFQTCVPDLRISPQCGCVNPERKVAYEDTHCFYCFLVPKHCFHEHCFFLFFRDDPKHTVFSVFWDHPHCFSHLGRRNPRCRYADCGFSVFGHIVPVFTSVIDVVSCEDVTATVGIGNKDFLARHQALRARDYV